MPTLRKLPASHLNRAVSSRSVVEFRRRRWDKSPIHGIVLSFSSELVLLQKLEDDIALGGYLVVRRQQISRFTNTPEYGEFFMKALALRKQKPKQPRSLDLTDLGSLLMSCSQRFRLVVIHQESRDPDSCWVGVPQSVDRGNLMMRCVRADGMADADPIAFALRSITMVEFGTSYDEALRLVAEANHSLERKRQR